MSNAKGKSPRGKSLLFTSIISAEKRERKSKEKHRHFNSQKTFPPFHHFQSTVKFRMIDNNFSSEKISS